MGNSLLIEKWQQSGEELLNSLAFLPAYKFASWTAAQLKEIKEAITVKKIAVLGGGNGAHTMAADLTQKGYEVTMCEAPEFREGISKTFERQAIDLIDAWGESTRSSSIW